MYKILFLGETYRADALTWIRGLKDYGGFEIITYEMEHAGQGWKRLLRIMEFLSAISKVRRIIRLEKPDLIIAERVTSYGFLAALTGFRPYLVAQQGITDIYPPHSITAPFKVLIQKYTFHKVALIHAWGEAMTNSMLKHGADKNKILVMPKGIDLQTFTYSPQKKLDKIRAIVTRSLTPDYRHHIILRAFAEIKQKGIPFELTIVGDGVLREELITLSRSLNIQCEIVFTGRIPNHTLPDYLRFSNLYLSMPCTEGMSASLLEAFATGCYPIVTDLPGNRAWIEHNINGMLVPIDRADLLAQAITDFWQQKEISFESAVQVNVATVREKADYSKNMKRISDIYHEIIKKHLPAN